MSKLYLLVILNDDGDYVVDGMTFTDDDLDEMVFIMDQYCILLMRASTN